MEEIQQEADLSPAEPEQLPEETADVEAPPEATVDEVLAEIAETEPQADLSSEAASPESVPPDHARLRGLLEAIIYVSEEPLSLAQISQGLGMSESVILPILGEVIKACEQQDRGVLIREVAGGFKMGTKPEFHEELRTFVKNLKPPLKLSLAALETLAVIAYKQPITAPEIMEVRGVQGAGVLKTLLERKLITAAGRKQVVGRPVLYKTTKEFLIQFGLKDLAELPSLKEFEEWSRLAIGEPEPEPQPAAQAQEPPAPEPEAAPETSTDA